MVRGSVDHERLRCISNAVAAMRSVLAWQKTQTLFVRKLVLGATRPHCAAEAAHGVSRKRRRHDTRGCCYYAHSGCVVGATLGHVLRFMCCAGHFQMADVVQHVYQCLSVAAAALASCSGWDAERLAMGVGTRRVLSSQLRMLPESKEARKAAARYGRAGTAIGLSTCIYCAISLAASNRRHAASLHMAADVWIDMCLRQLNSLSCHKDGDCGTGASESMHAERRALQRASLALKAAKRHTEGKPKSTAIELFPLYMRRALWPTLSPLDASGHEQLCRWIASDEFAPQLQIGADAGIQGQPSRVDGIPLAAVGAFAARESDAEDGSEDTSLTDGDTCSSDPSCYSSSSSGSSVGIALEQNAACAMQRLADLFA